MFTVDINLIQFKTQFFSDRSIKWKNVYAGEV